jgi:two-component system sensor histidine kinase SenX3
LVQEVLDLSRLQGGEPLPEARVVAVDVVIDEALDRARLIAEVREIALHREGTAGLYVLGDESQLATAVTNLLQNAIAYSSDGTTVSIRVDKRDDQVEIAVSDHGIGIPQDEQERIFERFYRVDPARSRETGGTGLGLSIVKHTVENHGGNLAVSSRISEGSTFTIRLAAVDGSQRPEAANPTLEQAGAS